MQEGCFSELPYCGTREEGLLGKKHTPKDRICDVALAFRDKNDSSSHEEAQIIAGTGC